MFFEKRSSLFRDTISEEDERWYDWHLDDQLLDGSGGADGDNLDGVVPEIDRTVSLKNYGSFYLKLNAVNGAVFTLAKVIC